MAARDDKAMVGLLRRGLSGREASAANCPGPDLLAAYYDRSLDAAEVARWETHFAACAHCRAQLAALARAEGPEAPATRPAWLGGWRWLAPAAAALAVVVILVVVRFSPRFAHKEVAQSAQTATAPATQSPPSQPLVAQNAAAPPPEPAPRQPIPPRKEAHPPRAAGTAGAVPADTAAAPGIAGGIVAGKKAVSTLAQNAVQAEKANPEQETETRPTTEARPQTESENNPVVGGAAAPPVRVLVAPGAAVPTVTAAAPSVPAEQPENASRRGRFAAGAREGAGRGVGASLKTVEAGPAQVIIPTPNVAVVWRIAPEGAIERSTDAGKTWKVQWMNLPGVARDSMVGVSGGRGRIGPALGSGQQLTAGSAASTKVCWIVGRAGAILRTTDGKHWRKIPAPATANLVSVDARNKRSATVTTADGRIFSTEDGGRTWQPNP